MSKHSVAEVRALSDGIRRIAGGALSDYDGVEADERALNKAADMLLELAERIKADERAMGRIDFKGMWNAMSDRVATSPPAQSAQVDALAIIECELAATAPGGSMEHAANHACLAYVKNAITNAATAEPVAQGEVVFTGLNTDGTPRYERLAAQPRAVPDAYVGELIEAAAEVYRISDREHEAWRRLRAALVAARKAQRPRVSDAAVEPVTQGEQVSPPRYSYGADDSVMLLNPEDSTYTRGAPAASPDGVPDGWKLVPVEATPEMLAAGYDQLPRNMYGEVRRKDAVPVWEAMLAAAPQPGESQS